MKRDRWLQRLDDLEDDLFARGAHITIDPDLDDESKVAVLEEIVAFEDEWRNAIDDWSEKRMHDC